MANQTVSRWRKEWKQGGKRALAQAGRAGRKPQLNAQQSNLLAKKLAGPEKLGYETPLWTCQRVGHLIEQSFGIRYHPGHVLKILRGLHWSRSPHIVLFLKKLLRVITGKLLIVWDGLTAHRSKLVKDFLLGQEGRIAIQRLPAYAPELNPVEYIWAHLKQHELPNVCAMDLAVPAKWHG